MIDLLAWAIGFFLVCILMVIILIGAKILHAFFTTGTSNEKQSCNMEEDDNQIEKNSREDSEADMIMTSDDEDSFMFPPEFDDDY